MNCELCGTPVKVVGKTTQHYEPIAITLDDIELCPATDCDRGKVMMKTESSVVDCPVCDGRGFRVNP